MVIRRGVAEAAGMYRMTHEMVSKACSLRYGSMQVSRAC
jgi:hypothetical protein